MTRPRVLHSPLSRVFYALFGGALVGLPLIAAIMIFAADGPSGMSVGLATGLGVLVLVGVFMLRLAMLRVVLHDDHVEMVNPLRTFRFYWYDVEDIDIISSGGWIVRVWAGGVPRWAWGVSRFGRFGLPVATVHDDPAKDAPRSVYEGYREMRATWSKGRH